MSNLPQSAFSHSLVVAAGLVLQPVTDRHWEILVELDRPDLGLRSPVRRMRCETNWLRNMEDDGNLGYFSEEERAELVFLFARPLEEIEVEFLRGRHSFRQAAVEAVEERLPDILLEDVLTASLKHFLAWLEAKEKELLGRTH